MSYGDDLEYGDRQMIATFGRPVRLPGTHSDNTILAVFDSPYVRTDMPDGGFVQGTVITLTLISTEASGLRSRDTVSVPQLLKRNPDGSGEWTDWVSFSVREVQPDGAGLSVVYLDPLTTSDNSEYSTY